MIFFLNSCSGHSGDGTGIAAASYHRVKSYFQGVDARDMHDNLFGKVLNVKDTLVLSFAEHVQQLVKTDGEYTSNDAMDS